jgi:transcriptional regulator with XRE-family HTH domain
MYIVRWYHIRMTEDNSDNAAPPRKRRRRKADDATQQDVVAAPPRIPAKTGRKFAPAQTALAAWMEVCGMSAQEIADRTGISLSSIYGLRKGFQRASLETATALVHLAGGQLSYEDFLDPDAAEAQRLRDLQNSDLPHAPVSAPATDPRN